MSLLQVTLVSLAVVVSMIIRNTFAQTTAIVIARLEKDNLYESRIAENTFFEYPVPDWHLITWHNKKISGNIILLSQDLLLMNREYSRVDTSLPIRKASMPTNLLLEGGEATDKFLDFTGLDLNYNFITNAIFERVGLYELEAKLFNHNYLKLDFVRPVIDYTVKINHNYTDCLVFGWSNRVFEERDKRRIRAEKKKLKEFTYSENLMMHSSFDVNIICENRHFCTATSETGRLCNPLIDDNLPVLCGPTKSRKLTFLVAHTSEEWKNKTMNDNCMSTFKVYPMAIIEDLVKWRYSLPNRPFQDPE